MKPHWMFKKSIIRILMVTFGLVAFTTGITCASNSTESTISSDEALRKLIEGNQNYVENKLTITARSNAATRASLATAQKPYAIILSCSDSRVPPEIIFDKGLGEIFVIRVAGNIPDPIVLGSIEYAAEHLGCPLIMVLGHERCGAVTATVDSQGKADGSENIAAIIQAIQPSMQAAATDCDACKGQKDCAAAQKSAFVECVSQTNAKIVAANLTKDSKILRHMVEGGKIKIVAATYDLDDGKVTLW